MNKKLLYASLLLLCILGAKSGHGQVILKIIPPDLSALKDSNQCNIQMINTGNEHLTLQLLMDLKPDTNGNIYSAKSRPVILQAFESKNLAWDTLVISKKRFTSHAQKQILHGFYKLCLEAVEVKNRKKMGEDCLQINIED